MTSAPRVLIATKETRLDLEEPAKKALIQRLGNSHQGSLDKLHLAHHEHNHALEVVTAEVQRRGWAHEVIPHTQVENVDGFDLVITVGGDGTVLNVSHFLRDQTPLLAINSAPSSSVGYFCASDADNVAETLDAYEAKTLTPFALCRLSISINGKPCGIPVLNDVLLADNNPAATSRYVLTIAGLEERQRSSGIWISTPAGSTAAIRSAGGSVLPLRSSLMQYIIREPYLPKDKRYMHLGGVQEGTEPFTVISLMNEGRLYLDGPHHTFNLRIGDQIEVSPNAPPLNILGLYETRRFF